MKNAYLAIALVFSFSTLSQASNLLCMGHRISGEVYRGDLKYSNLLIRNFSPDKMNLVKQVELTENILPNVPYEIIRQSIPVSLANTKTVKKFNVRFSQTIGDNTASHSYFKVSPKSMMRIQMHQNAVDLIDIQISETQISGAKRIAKGDCIVIK